jgi:hypothetical protein
MPYLTYETTEGRNSLKSIVAQTIPATSPLYAHDGGARQATLSGDTNQDHPRPQTAGNPNEELVKGYLNTLTSWNSPALHIRRTLDQFFFHDLPDIGKGTDHDDVDDQVVGKYAKRHRITPRIFMVDQLWLWILDESRFTSTFRLPRLTSDNTRNDNYKFSSKMAPGSGRSAATRRAC